MHRQVTLSVFFSRKKMSNTDITNFVTFLQKNVLMQEKIILKKSVVDYDEIHFVQIFLFYCFWMILK